jgi:S1-C subfamily serine protease
MSKPRRLLSSPFGSALLGGAVVAALGWIAIAAGWIQAEGDSTTTVAAPLAAPVVDRGEDGESNVVNQIYKRDGEGVAFIESEVAAQAAAPSAPFSPFGEPQPEGGGTATGSGFVIDKEGHLLTNNHVVEGADGIQVKLGDSETTYDAELVGADPSMDLALLDVQAPESVLHPLRLGRSAEMEVGDPVVAIGNPFGLDRTVTSGIVSALQRQIEAPDGFSITDVIQTDAAINPGNSGGPLINAAGEVIGINSQIATGGGGGGNVGIGFAIPIDTVRSVLDELESSGEVEHAYLGISGATIDEDLAKAVNLPVDEGVLVQEVVKDSPADEAGIEGGRTAATIEGAQAQLGGDIITAVDGEKVASMDEIVEAINESRPGDELELTLRRGDETKTVTVTLGDRPDSSGESGE